MSAYDQAFDTVYTREMLTLVLRLVEEFYRNFGKFPNATELRGLLMRPS